MRPVFFLIILSMNSNAASWEYDVGNPDCPWKKPGNLWAIYLSSGYGAHRPTPLQMRFNKQTQTKVAPNLPQNGCFTMTNWEIGSKQFVSTFGANRAGTGPLVRCLNIIDPTNYKIPVCGLPLTFDEGGNVYHKDHKDPIGALYCTLKGPNC